MTRKLTLQFIFVILFLLSGTGISMVQANNPTASASHALYSELNEINQNDLPPEEVFALAFKGYNALSSNADAIKKEVITIIDFSLPSTAKRLWIIDLKKKKILFNDYVAHGKNSGDDVAVSFSNTSGSNMSSIGFYLTGETYQGKHGLSLRLEGMDGQFNSNARDRAIVMHGADYVSHDFIKKYGRLGRSLGCPSVPMDIHEQVINTIKDGSALFIYYPDPAFLKNSQLLNSPEDFKA